MILHCNFEEIQALKSGASAFLGLEPGSENIPVAAPPLAKARVEALLSQLDGDLSVSTLADQRQLESGVRTVVEFLQGEMKALIADHSPTDEGAMDAYLDFAKAYSVLARLRTGNFSDGFWRLRIFSRTVRAWPRILRTTAVPEEWLGVFLVAGMVGDCLI